MNKLYIDPAKLHWLINGLVYMILQSPKKYKKIVGIANGGLNISSCLSYHLDIPHTTITIRLRDGVKEVNIENAIELPKPFLLVDDIVDSGETLKVFKSFGYIQGDDFDVATLHWCPENSHEEKPDFYIETKKVTDWIVYPWEKEYEEYQTKENSSR